MDDPAETTRDRTHNAMEHMAGMSNTDEPLSPPLLARAVAHRPASHSLFAMAAWKRMVIGLGALLFLWLVILWAIGA